MADTQPTTETRGETCTLVSKSCTTSAFDTFGELWLCPSGLLRTALGLRKTLKRGIEEDWKVVGAARPTRGFSGSEIASLGMAGKHNHWISWGHVRDANLKLGIIEHSLHLTLVNGTRVVFGWPKWDGGFDFLAQELPQALGTRLTLHRRWIG